MRSGQRLADAACAMRLESVGPVALSRARVHAHHAAQILARSAGANIAPASDDSHTSMTWNSSLRCFETQPMQAPQGQCRVALSLAPLSIALKCPDGMDASLGIEGVPLNEAGRWMDDRLRECALRPAHRAPPPYAMPELSDALPGEEPMRAAQFLALSEWFHMASAALHRFLDARREEPYARAAVRCWPHHFDIGAYLKFDEGDPETARAINLGMSPGDEIYAQPYFYATPWPYPGTCALPALLQVGHWHIEGYVGAIATAERLLDADCIDDAIDEFLDHAFNAAAGLIDISPATAR